MIPALLAALLGAWLTASPEVLGYADLPVASTVAHVIGPLAVTAGLTSAFEVLRPVRWVTVLLGVLLVLSIPLGALPVAAWNHALVGGALGVLGSRRGRLRHRMGGGWAALRWRVPPRARA